MIHIMSDNQFGLEIRIEMMQKKIETLYSNW